MCHPPLRATDHVLTLEVQFFFLAAAGLLPQPPTILLLSRCDFPSSMGVPGRCTHCHCAKKAIGCWHARVRAGGTIARRTNVLARSLCTRSNLRGSWSYISVAGTRGASAVVEHGEGRTNVCNTRFNSWTDGVFYLWILQKRPRLPTTSDG